MEQRTRPTLWSGAVRQPLSGGERAPRRYSSEAIVAIDEPADVSLELGQGRGLQVHHVTGLEVAVLDVVAQLGIEPRGPSYSVAKKGVAKS
jgi:hypothetical protein